MAHPPNEPKRVVGCIAEIAAAPFDLSILSDAGELKADGAPGFQLDDATRRRLITSIRQGNHVEAEFSAKTFLQEDGKPNLKSVRFKHSRLGAVARSFKDRPYIFNHNQWSQEEVMGRILSSELVNPSDTGGEFLMRLRAVKPPAVIGLLDGTIQTFSIGWRPTGPVICTVHRTPARQQCRCWPGEMVEVDGAQKMVEYEFQDAVGVEVSAVVVPAVTGTRIEEIRSALAAEINVITREPIMDLSKLAAALGLPATATADEVMAAALRQLTSTSAERTELAALRTEVVGLRATVAQAKDALAAGIAAAKAEAKIDGLIAKAYADGKLLHVVDDKGASHPAALEPALRAIGGSDVAALETYLSALPGLVPTGSIVAGAAGVQPPASSPTVNPYLDGVARDLGLDPKLVAAKHRELKANGGI